MKQHNTMTLDNDMSNIQINASVEEVHNMSDGNAMSNVNIKSKSEPIRIEQESPPNKREKSKTWEDKDEDIEVIDGNNGGSQRHSKSLINFVQYMED